MCRFQQTSAKSLEQVQVQEAPGKENNQITRKLFVFVTTSIVGPFRLERFCMDLIFCKVKLQRYSGENMLDSSFLLPVILWPNRNKIIWMNLKTKKKIALLIHQLISCMWLYKGTFCYSVASDHYPLSSPDLKSSSWSFRDEILEKQNLSSEESKLL